MLFHGWVLGKLGVETFEHNVFELIFPYGGIEISYSACVFIVIVLIGHGHLFWF